MVASVMTQSDNLSANDGSPKPPDIDHTLLDCAGNREVGGSKSYANYGVKETDQNVIATNKLPALELLCAGNLSVGDHGLGSVNLGSLINRTGGDQPASGSPPAVGQRFDMDRLRELQSVQGVPPFKTNFPTQSRLDDSFKSDLAPAQMRFS
jgi:hypothetical protein